MDHVVHGRDEVEEEREMRAHSAPSLTSSSLSHWPMR